MDRFQLDWIARNAGCWMSRPSWEKARDALREGRILPPKWMLEAAYESGDSEAALACVEWVFQAVKIEEHRAAMKEIEAEERERLRAIAKRRKAIEKAKAREEALA